MPDIHFNNLVITDPTVVRKTLEDYVSFGCDLGVIHNSVKKAAVCSLNNYEIDYLFHDTNLHPRDPYQGNGNLRGFIACHTIIAVYSRGFTTRIDIDKANREKEGTGNNVESEDNIMLQIFSDCIKDNFGNIWDEREKYSKAYYEVLVNNNFVIAELEEYKPSSDVLIQKSDMLAFIFAKLRVLDDKNQYYPQAKELYSNLFSQYSISNSWCFTKVYCFNSCDHLSKDLDYAMNHLSHNRFVPPNDVMVESDMLNRLTQDPFAPYIQADSGGDCIIL
jgi:hypothetical protein